MLVLFLLVLLGSHNRHGESAKTTYETLKDFNLDSQQFISLVHFQSFIFRQSAAETAKHVQTQAI